MVLRQTGPDSSCFARSQGSPESLSSRRSADRAQRRRSDEWRYRCQSSSHQTQRRHVASEETPNLPDLKTGNPLFRDCRSGSASPKCLHGPKDKEREAVFL